VAVATIVLSWLEYWYRNVKLYAVSFLIRIGALGFLFDVVYEGHFKRNAQKVISTG